MWCHECGQDEDRILDELKQYRKNLEKTMKAYEELADLFEESKNLIDKMGDIIEMATDGPSDPVEWVEGWDEFWEAHEAFWKKVKK